MKQWICVCLAAVMLLSALTGCSKEETEPAAQEETPAVETEIDVTPTLFYDITGIPQDEIVMTVGQTEIPAEFYFYWLSYSCSSLEYFLLSNSDGGSYADCVDTTTGAIDWSATYNGVPLMDYARAQAEGIVGYYAAVEEMAAENGVSLTEDDRTAMAESIETAEEEQGGEEAFVGYLRMLGIGVESFERISAVDYLSADLLYEMLDEESSLYLSDQTCEETAFYADHILLATCDIYTGVPLSDAEVEEKRALAEDLLAQLSDADDPVALFDELADEYSEDPGRLENPSGFVYVRGYTSGLMPDDAEKAAAALETGEISGIVESDYGFHIILRRDLSAALAADESLRVSIAEEYLTSLLAMKKNTLTATYDACLDDMAWDTFYDSYIVKSDAIAAELGVDIAP